MAGLHAGPRPCVVLAGARAPWEPALLGVLARAQMVVLRRCVDLADLLAVVGTGQADAAVLSADLVGLDADAVRRLLAHDVRPLVVAEPGADVDRMTRLGLPVVATAEEVPATIEALLAAEPAAAATSPAAGAGAPGGGGPAGGGSGPRSGRVVAVWGPTGAPGRTTVAVGIAAALARRADPGATLLDVDPWGGAVGQALGILDETSGLLASARAANEGALDAAALGRCLRRAGPGLDVLTGLPRPDRWIEVRAGVVEQVVALARSDGSDVVVDCGFALERDGTALDRNTATLEALSVADTVVVVGSAEPTGLSRLVRGLVELGEVVPGARTHVVVNRMRETLGWSRHDVTGMVEGFAPAAPVHLLPLDVATADRAARTAVPVAELGETALGQALAACADAVLPARGRPAATRAQLPNSRYRPAKV
ncbi:MAG: AAA family ATPase [Marmoricola sp.]